MENGLETHNSVWLTMRSHFGSLIKRHFRLFSWVCFGLWMVTMYALLHILSTGL